MKAKDLVVGKWYSLTCSGCTGRVKFLGLCEDRSNASIICHLSHVDCDMGVCVAAIDDLVELPTINTLGNFPKKKGK